MKKIISILSLLLCLSYIGCQEEILEPSFDGFWINSEQIIDVCKHRNVYYIFENQIQEELVLTGLSQCPRKGSYELYYVGLANEIYDIVDKNTIYINSEKYKKSNSKIPFKVN